MKYWRTGLVTIATIIVTMFFSWLTTLILGDGDMTFFAFMTGTITLCLFIGGALLTFLVFFEDVARVEDNSWKGDV